MGLPSQISCVTTVGYLQATGSTGGGGNWLSLDTPMCSKAKLVTLSNEHCEVCSSQNYLPHRPFPWGTCAQHLCNFST